MRRSLLVLPLLLAAAACGAGAVPADEVARQAEGSLEEQLGDDLDLEVSCPGDLPAEVGAELRCALTAGEDPEEHVVTMTVTSVEGDRAEFDVQVDDQPTG